MERVQKIVARCLGMSRRKAEELIREGRVAVNGRVVALGTQADGAADRVTVDGKPLKAEPAKVYLLLNKPRNYLCTVSDPGGRPTVLELVKSKVPVYPVGRLDFDSTGLVILTNDGAVAYRIQRAGTHCPKVYLVKVAGTPDEAKLDRLRRGITIDGERFAPCEIVKSREKAHSYSWLKVTLFEGRNRQLRRMFDFIHHPVFQLKRVAIGPLTDAGLPVGFFRPLTDTEVSRLRSLPVAAGKGRLRPK